MKKYIFSLTMLAVALVMAGCHKDLMDYEGQDCLFFDVQYGASWGDTTVWSHQIYTPVEFGSADEDELIKRAKVAVAGSVVDYDRPFVLEVVADSTTAIQGEEFEILNEKFYIPAGLNHTYIEVKFKKSARMAENTYQLQLRLRPNEHFTTSFSEVGNIPGRWTNDTKTEYSQNFDPNIHNFFINDMLTKPRAWHNVQYGTFSAKKYEIILRVSYEKFGFTKKDFEGEDAYNKMLAGRAVAIARVTSKFLKDQYAMGRDYWVIDEDGTMMWINGVPWAQGTRPEDMVDN